MNGLYGFFGEFDCQITRISATSRPRGSWKYQDRYNISCYAPRQRKDGTWIWDFVWYCETSLSEPQIRRSDWPKTEGWMGYGSIRNFSCGIN